MPKILDCTFRDGGYYTNWDFDDVLVDRYLSSVNQLPIDYVEVGYRSRPLEGYYGRFFYCPISLLRILRQKCQKKIAIILNEKDVRVNDVEELLGPCVEYVDMVRIAVNPAHISRAVDLAKEIKAYGYEVAFNVMYMSNWGDYDNFFDSLGQLNGLVDAFYMVDSYGGVYPEDVERTVHELKKHLSVPLGFHGHNNLQLGLINTLKARELGVEFLDATITGMGRGAGNLRTELLLTALNGKYGLKVDFNALSKVVGGFEEMQRVMQWGTSLPYMVSGANSLPQKDVMEWMVKRYYSLNSIIRALANQSSGVEDNQQFESYTPVVNLSRKVLILGGGPSVLEHSESIIELIANDPSIMLIHASSKNARIFEDLENEQIFCLMGNEGHRLEDVFGNQKVKNGSCLLPPYPRKMGTYIPEVYLDNCFELEKEVSTTFGANSQTSMALTLCELNEVEEAMLIGFDGYSGSNITSKDQELFIENENLFLAAKKMGMRLEALTPTRYQNLIRKSIYERI